jgi:hypothetical protein
MKLLPLFLLLGTLFFHAVPVHAAQEVYAQGCPDTVKLAKLLKEGEIADVLKELTNFSQFVPVIPKPCNVVVQKLYGISYLSQEPELAKLYWRSMLYLDPRAEVFDLNILSYKVQSQFDKVKADMVRSGHIQNAYSEKYIPPVYPDVHDTPRVEAWKRFYHELRLLAYSREFEYSRTKLKDTLQAWVKRGEKVDPAFLILEGDLKTRRYAHRGETVFEASTLIQNGEEILRSSGSTLVDPVSLKEWAKRLKARFAVAGDAQ